MTEPTTFVPFEEAKTKLLECFAKIPGDSPETIREFMKTNGIKGKPVQSQFCVLAEFFKKCSGLDRITVGPYGVSYPVAWTPCSCDDPDCSTDSLEYAIEFSARVNAPFRYFIANFDRRNYPELIDE